MRNHDYFVYIMTNPSRTLYIGITGDLERRVSEHKLKLLEGFTRRYNITRLVYYEHCREVRDAIAREKQLKRWSRTKKIALIERLNPGWRDLSEPGELPRLRPAPSGTPLGMTT